MGAAERQSRKKQRAALAIDATRGTPFGNFGARC
jgi:hypothetical protein